MKDKHSHVGELIVAPIVILGVFLLPVADIVNKSIVSYPFIYGKIMESCNDPGTVIIMNDNE